MDANDTQSRKQDTTTDRRRCISLSALRDGGPAKKGQAPEEKIRLLRRAFGPAAQSSASPLAGWKLTKRD